jgi:hypothetical protein
MLSGSLSAMLALMRPLATLAVTVAVLAPTAAVAEPGNLRETTESTYTLRPDESDVGVVHRITLTNERRKGKIKAWGPIRIPAEAEQPQISSNASAIQAVDSDAIGTTNILEIVPIKPRQKRTVKVSYDVASVPPGLPLTTRITPDYARFCWWGVGAENGSVQARIPAGWTTDTTLAAVRVTPVEGWTVLEKPRSVLPGDFYACTDAFRDGTEHRVYVLGPSEQLITIDAWLLDPEWREVMSRAVAIDLPALETLIGPPLPYPELRLQEVARSMPLHTRGDLRPESATLYIDEDLDDPAVATVALARTWFNPTTIAEPWLEQGLALWAGSAAVEQRCPEVGDAPIDPPPDLANWQSVTPAQTATDRLILAWQSAVACTIIEEAAVALGPLAMTQITTTLLGRPEPADRFAWLEAVEAQGVAAAEPIDTAFATQTLIEHGILSEADLAAIIAAE